ncbi:MAG TPA: hypothetical protein VGU44_03205 [Gammaproteobacteria bacterium]|nr:hypothetical protein [Gammaproteobacteria bacterium]
MPRIRSVKPELFTHECLFEAESDYKLPLRLAFIALFTQCDQWGRFRWQPKRLKLNILPYDEIDVIQIFDALAMRGFIEKYEVQGEWYGRILSWAKHQRITRPEHPSGIPSPEGIFHSKPTKKNNPKHKKKISPPSLLDEALHSAIPLDVDAALLLPVPMPADVIQIAVVPDSVQIENEEGCSTAGISHNLVQTESERECNTGCTNAHTVHTENVLGSNAGCIEYDRGRTWYTGNMEYGNGIGNREYGNGVGNNTIVASETRPLQSEDPVTFIFQHWQTVMKHPFAKLDRDRRSLIKSALRQYSVAQLCQAITGCSITPHNRGENDRGERYDGLHIILKNAEQVERFMRHYHKPPQSNSDATRRTNANLHTLHEWGQEKIEEERKNGSR